MRPIPLRQYRETRGSVNVCAAAVGGAGNGLDERPSGPYGLRVKLDDNLKERGLLLAIETMIKLSFVRLS